MNWRVILLAVTITFVAVAVAADEADIFCRSHDAAIAWAHGEDVGEQCGSFVEWWGRPAEGELHFIEEVVGTPYSLFTMVFENNERALVVLPSDV